MSEHENTGSIDDRLAEAEARIEYLLNANRTQAQTINTMAITLGELERRLESLELNAGKVNKTSDVPLWLQEKVTKGMHQLTGKLTAAEVAETLGLPTDHANLIRLGRYLQTLGVRRGRTGEKRYYWFVR